MVLIRVLVLWNVLIMMRKVMLFYKLWSQYIANAWPLAYAYHAKGTECLVHMLLLMDML